MNDEFENKLIKLASSNCTTEVKAEETIASLINTVAGLLVFLYVRTKLISYKDFVNRLDKILEITKQACIEKYEVALEEEL